LPYILCEEETNLALFRSAPARQIVIPAARTKQADGLAGARFIFAAALISDQFPHDFMGQG
jgi:hypothetical protein